MRRLRPPATVDGMMWGKRKENGIWRPRVDRPRWRIMWRGHDSLYIAAGHWRVRLMKPW
jgi:hypothetical protein